MDEEDNVRAPDQVVTGSLYDDSETPDTLQDRIQQLQLQGLSLEQATAIAQDQLQIAQQQHRNMNLENTVAILKQQMEAKERERQYKNKMASEASSSSDEAKLEALIKRVSFTIRFDEDIKALLQKALQNKKENGFRSQLEIKDSEYHALANKIDKFVKGNRMTKEDGVTIVDLFTTPLHEVSDYEGYNSDYDGYDTSGGRRTRKARKSRKSRKSKKTKKNKRRTRKNKRK